MSADLLFFDVSGLPALPEDNQHLLDVLGQSLEDRRDKGKPSRKSGVLGQELKSVLDELTARFGSLDDIENSNVWMSSWPSAYLDGRYITLNVDFDSLEKVAYFATSACQGSSILLADLQRDDSVLYRPEHPTYSGRTHDRLVRKALGVVEPLSTDEVLGQLAKQTSLDEGKLAEVFDALVELTVEEFSPKRSGKLQLPHLGTLESTIRPGVPARKGFNPFTEEVTIFKAKPGRVRIRVSPHSELQERLLALDWDDAG